MMENAGKQKNILTAQKDLNIMFLLISSGISIIWRVRRLVALTEHLLEGGTEK